MPSSRPAHPAGSLIVLSAPSGAGKTTLCKKILEEFQITLSISSTTRAPRGTEKEGIDYFFLSQEEFERQIQNQGFAEWAIVHGNYYGTSREVVEKNLQSCQSVLLDIDVQGAEQLFHAFGKQCIRIFIAPPSLEALRARLRNRGTDSEATIERRMQQATQEMAAASSFDHIIVNDSIDRAYSELRTLLEMRYHLTRKRI